MKAQQKRKALCVILAVSALTLYNILPTIFFYSKNLKGAVTTQASKEIALQMTTRVNSLENETLDWVKSYCKLLKIHPEKISLNQKTPALIEVLFPNESMAADFSSHMVKAGNLIPFFPKRILPLDIGAQDLGQKSVILKREIPLHFDNTALDSYFSFIPMFNEKGALSSEYRDILDDKVLEISSLITSSSTTASTLEQTIGSQYIGYKIPYFIAVADALLQYKSLFQNKSTLQNQFYASVFRSSRYAPTVLYDHCLQGFQATKDLLQKEKIELIEKMKKDSSDQAVLDLKENSLLATLKEQEEKLLSAIALLQNKKGVLTSSKAPSSDLYFSELKNNKIEGKKYFTLSTKAYNPLISSLYINYDDKSLSFELSDEFISYLHSKEPTEQKKLSQLIFDEMAKVQRSSPYEIERNGPLFTLYLSSLPDAKSLLTLDLRTVAEKKIASLKSILNTYWQRNSKEISPDTYTIVDWEEYKTLSDESKEHCLAFYAPILDKESSLAGFENDSIYLIGKNLLSLNKASLAKENLDENDSLATDLSSLDRILRQFGGRVYEGSSFPFPQEFKDDYIFKISDYYKPLLDATREQWKVSPSSKYATLEFSDLKQRILTLNAIETAQHAELLKWQDEYNKSSFNPNAEGHLLIPPPTKSPLLSNLALSTAKYFRGDEKKILHWGLDLNGGTTVRVALKDKQNKPVTSEEDLNQGVNELYNRVNKMGVSDVTIRKEGSFITLDFPSTQTLSASELITASSMTFHVVNETFSIYNSDIAHPLARFLQEVWNEALVTGKTDEKSINEIAFTRLYGEHLDPLHPFPRGDAEKSLLDYGLQLANPTDPNMTFALDDTFSKIGVLEGDSFEDWNGMTNPLIVLFNNYALEGSWLKDIHSGYDPNTGNYLSFSVDSKKGEEGLNPRDILYNWTSVFSTSQMKDSKYSKVTHGNGWRLSAVLNGKIISMPRLQDALKDGGRISGSFSQKEVSRLAADLRAGSLTYTPEIISETTISPELGAKERAQGIMATVIAFFAVIAIMIGYYRFAGLIASIAVVFNILIIWATLQNLGASLTLAGIAGIILTIGMAVDANVLIFERVREENEKHSSIANALTNGYSKAFSAIFDSNITTIIAALILLNFDAGPVKGFALTLIIGITSSMFTALYMTRTFFNFWLKKGKKQTLKMANLFPDTSFPFLKYGQIATFIATSTILIGGVMLYKQKGTLFGMDFTGGMTVTLELAHKEGSQPKLDVEQAFISHGISPTEFSIRELNNPYVLKVYLSNALTLPGRPFAHLQQPSLRNEITYPYEKNPKLSALVSILEKSGVALTPKSLESVDKHFSSISGQMSHTMRNNALLGIGLAMLSILIYLTVRFEFSYALSATIGLAFDLLLTLAFLGICKALGLPLTIDLNTIAALMTIIGYSLNDTIIVFDRIRDELKRSSRLDLKEVINLSLNKTLSRTMMTSLTTLVVLLSLVVLGGKSIFNFSFLMMIGVIVGTISSLFLASTFLYFFKRKETKKIPSVSIVSLPS